MPSTFIKTFDTPTFKGTITIPLGLYIEGEFVDPVEGGIIEWVSGLHISSLLFISFMHSVVNPGTDYFVVDDS